MTTTHDLKRQKRSHQQSAQDDVHEASASSPGSVSGHDDAASCVRQMRRQKHDVPDSTGQTNTRQPTSKLNLLEIQTQDLLERVQFDYEKSWKTNDGVLRILKMAFEAIETKEPLTIGEAGRQMYNKHRIRVPFPHLHPEGLDDFKLSVSQPTKVNIVGSYALRTMVRNQPRPSIDMVVCMPNSLFQEKDHLNYRYFYKRAYFLACMAVVAKNSLEDTHDVTFSRLLGNSLLPILSLRSKAGIDIMSGIDIKVIPCIAEDLFKSSKVRPDRNLLRNQDRHLTASTPFYSASIRADSLYSAYLRLHHQTALLAANFKDACALGRIWLDQRAFAGDIDRGGFGPFEWATLTALLLNTKHSKEPSPLLKSHTSCQLFKGVLRYLVQNDFVKNPVVLGKSDFEPPSCRDPMFFDGERGINVLFKVSHASYRRLLYEVGMSLKVLDDVSTGSSLNAFEALFITKKRQDLVTYDSLFRLTSSSERDHESPEIQHRFDYRVYDVLREGLGDRVHLVHVQQSPISMWPISAHHTEEYSSILVGVTFNAMTIDRTVDYGPSAEEKLPAAVFRQFWGPKAELRRFRDGSILESLLWSKDSSTSIFAQIVDFVLARHFKTTATYLVPALSRSLSWLQDFRIAFDQVVQDYEHFAKDLRNLEDLPLQVRRISRTDSALSGFIATVPSMSSKAQRLPPVDVLIEFEGTGRWPDDIVAIQRTKLALLLKISRSFQQSVRGVSTKLGIENAGHTTMNCGFLDVSYSSCSTFRLRIFCDREPVLLEQLTGNKSDDFQMREEATATLALVRQSCQKLPLHTQSILSLCTRYPAFAETMRVVMYWFECHMLVEYLGRELIELIVAGVFLNTYPWIAPSSATTGLFRTLHFLSRWDWQSTPLIVDFSDRLDAEALSHVHLQFQAWRTIDPTMQRTAIFAASDHDLECIQPTSEAPSRMTAMRMTALSRSACAVVNNFEFSGTIESIFKPSEDEYDFVIRLARQTFGKDSVLREMKGHNAESRIVETAIEAKITEGYRISLFVRELRRIYSTSIVFFYSCHEPCSFIGALWKPQVVNRTFRVSSTHNVRPPANALADNQGAEVDVNKDALLREICRLGADLVTGIDVKN